MPFFGSALQEYAGPHKFKVAQCASCGLYRRCKSPKMQPAGDFERSILIIANAPESDEDQEGEAFVSDAGLYLEKQLSAVGINMRRDCLLTYAVICHPTSKDGKSRTATEKELVSCIPNIVQTIEKHKPEIIIAVGHQALKSVLDGIWLPAVKEMDRWVNWTIPLQKYNAWVCPVYHPSFIAQELRITKGSSIVEKLYHQNLKAIAELHGRPWATVPNYKDEIRVLFDEVDIARELKRMINRGGPIAFDYETNMLKPDAPDSQIVAASVCWQGEYTIAFPFGGQRVIELFKRLITSGQPLVSQNLKFEDRWSRVQLKVRPRQWAWDTMNEGHVLDNRTGCTALDFQAFVHLGFGSWDSYASPYLHTEHSYDKNTVHKADFAALCLYCGLDSHTTYHLANVQRNKLGLEDL